MPRSLTIAVSLALASCATVPQTAAPLPDECPVVRPLMTSAADAVNKAVWILRRVNQLRSVSERQVGEAACVTLDRTAGELAAVRLADAKLRRDLSELATTLTTFALGLRTMLMATASHSRAALETAGKQTIDTVGDYQLLVRRIAARCAP
jgi:hypothetical protein